MDAKNRNRNKIRCHTRTNFNRQDWINYFKPKMEIEIV